ncbi:hypothetical protein BJ508DRAFT_322121 [Ascobolus immersus RN42]|uniref:Uncharacterized protein n=1 Tax=Ascobolus immersus RN42 TaxID=1160509 RepID=A0A3N4IP68_ASCIM|nr:hypothetical protein BJ508DRAFT_322121 [Ascobolus immersus RN42]
MQSSFNQSYPGPVPDENTNQSDLIPAYCLVHGLPLFTTAAQEHPEDLSEVGQMQQAYTNGDPSSPPICTCRLLTDQVDFSVPQDVVSHEATASSPLHQANSPQQPSAIHHNSSGQPPPQIDTSNEQPVFGSHPTIPLVELTPHSRYRPPQYPPYLVDASVDPSLHASYYAEWFIEQDFATQQYWAQVQPELLAHRMPIEHSIAGAGGWLDEEKNLNERFYC